MRWRLDAVACAAAGALAGVVITAGLLALHASRDPRLSQPPAMMPL